MNKVIEYKQLGSYGIIIDNDKILLIKKYGGPYDNKLDLPGGTIEFNEKPVETLKRELKEETGIDIKKYDLYDTDSISFEWKHNNDLVKVHHIGIFYKINEYKGEIKKNQIINEINDDSKGAEFYKISELKKENLSEIVILILNKLGYKTSNE